LPKRRKKRKEKERKKKKKKIDKKMETTLEQFKEIRKTKQIESLVSETEQNPAERMRDERRWVVNDFCSRIRKWSKEENNIKMHLKFEMRKGAGKR
jgi:hypothetical protein